MTEPATLREYRAPSSLELAQLGLTVSPVVALWRALSGHTAPSYRAVAVALAWSAASVTLAIAVLMSAVATTTGALIWGTHTFLGTVCVVRWSRRRDAAHGDRTGADRRSRRWPATVATIVTIPSVLLFASVLHLVINQWLLLTVNAAELDAREFSTRFLRDLSWWLPGGVLFTIASLRAGRLRRPVELVQYGLAFIWVFLSYRLCLAISAAAARWVVPERWKSPADIAVAIVVTAIAVRVADWLAWGRGRWWLRAPMVPVVFALTLVNLALLTGPRPGYNFMVGRVLERSGLRGAALTVYRLGGKSTAEWRVVPYIESRAGFLSYQAGDLEGARRSFRRVVEDPRTATATERRAARYLNALDSGAGPRVVLPNLDGGSEARDAYCAPNTLSVVLRRWGIRRSPSDIGEQASHVGFGTNSIDIARTCERHGLDHIWVPFADVDDLRWLIDHGVPALVYVPRHVLAVIGYDERLGTLVTYDTSRLDTWTDQTPADFERVWQQRDFLLGVLLPIDATDATSNEIRDRFTRPSNLAAEHHMASNALTDFARIERLRAALIAAPDYYPAAFGLLDLADHDWLRRNADFDAVVARARRQLARMSGDGGHVATGLGAWYRFDGRQAELDLLADELAERDGLQRVAAIAGQAAADRGDVRRAALLLRSVESPDVAGLLALARAEHQLGERQRTVDALGALLDQSPSGPTLRYAMELAERSRDGLLAERAYAAYLSEDPGDVERLLRYGQLSLAVSRALANDDSARDVDRRRAATWAATLARAQATTRDDRERADRLLRRVAEVDD